MAITDVVILYEDAVEEAKAIVGRAVVLVGLLVDVFGIVLPRLGDYEAVRAALAG